MKPTRLTYEQIIGALKSAGQDARTGDIVRKHGVSEATICHTKSKHNGLEVRLSELVNENAKLKRLLVDTLLDNVGLIPTCNDHNPLAHLRCPMVIMRQG